MLTRQIDELKAVENGDRLTSLILLITCANLLQESVNGWNFWFRHLEQLTVFRPADLHAVAEKMRRLTTDCLKFDVDVTERQIELFSALHPQSEQEKATAKKETKAYA